MTQPFIGEIRMVGFDFAPRGYAFCNGQIISIAQNTALFSILGTTYGGDGRVTFALPNLQGRMPLGQGQGPGLTPRTLGEAGGASTHTLTTAEMPAHTHALRAADGAASTGTPGSGVALAATSGARVYRASANTATMGAGLAPTGGSQAHENRQPYLALNFIIAMQGVYPSRN